MDLSRYSDSLGFEGDPEIYHTWRYRDYVIDALNNDKPYDQFIKEQLAGGDVKGGSLVGETDEFGIAALERTTHARDVHATVLDLMGLDSKRLTYVQSDVSRRLTTETGADVLTEIIA